MYSMVGIIAAGFSIHHRTPLTSYIPQLCPILLRSIDRSFSRIVSLLFCKVLSELCKTQLCIHGYRLRKFRIYLTGIKSKIVTNCQAFAQTMKKTDTCTCIARWALLLQDFQYNIEHYSSHTSHNCVQFCYARSIDHSRESSGCFSVKSYRNYARRNYASIGTIPYLS